MLDRECESGVWERFAHGIITVAWPKTNKKDADVEMCFDAIIMLRLNFMLYCVIILMHVSIIATCELK